MRTRPYKGYTGTFEFEDDVYYGTVDSIKPDMVTFQTDAGMYVQSVFEDSVDDYLEMCAERGEEPRRPEGED